MKLTFGESTPSPSEYHFLEPNYESNGVINDVTVARELVREAELKMPCPARPKVDLDTWRAVIDLLDASVVPELAHELTDSDLSDCFEALSVKTTLNSDIGVSDLVKVDVHGNFDEENWTNHVEGVIEYAINVLPPVTAALMGGYVSEVRVFGTHYYKTNVLPDDKSYGGLHKPYRRSIDITDTCYAHLHELDTHTPNPNRNTNCTLLHELGHTVHNMYGFLRPGDHGYEYRMEGSELDSSGCINPINLSERQAEFVIDVFRSYALSHRDGFETARYNSYGLSHPAETFACAFGVLARQGGEVIKEDYPQYYDMFTHLL